ncbi:hypothetical protein BpHYR1_009382 [Brachionus plicatilis]|uniref:Uncharacterized protein n=1 Tax=Brachionus plicatilis TaxID=10195 RepID=A0A3M7Q897_BRAPC|nr:hypothetical protein BpHYR1_009382 [Brachionus plicatilis]
MDYSTLFNCLNDEFDQLLNLIDQNLETFFDNIEKEEEKQKKGRITQLEIETRKNNVKKSSNYSILTEAEMIFHFKLAEMFTNKSKSGKRDSVERKKLLLGQNMVIDFRSNILI